MSETKIPFYYEDEIEEIILPDDSDKKKTENSAVTVSVSTEGAEKTEEEIQIPVKAEEKENPLFA